MKEYYNEAKTEVRKRVNGSLKPLTNEQVKANQEKYGLNELIETKGKSIPVIFLEQFFSNYSNFCSYYFWSIR